MESGPREFIQTTAEVDNASWQHTIAVLKQATIENMLEDDGRRGVLEAVSEGEFWSMHVRLLEQLEAEQPGIAEVIMTRAEAVSEELRHKEMVEFETVTLPRAKRTALLRGMTSAFRL